MAKKNRSIADILLKLAIANECGVVKISADHLRTIIEERNAAYRALAWTGAPWDQDAEGHAPAIAAAQEFVKEVADG